MHIKLVTVQIIFVLQLAASTVNGPEKQHVLEPGSKQIQLKKSCSHDLWIKAKEELNIIRHKIKELHEETKEKFNNLIVNIQRRVDEVLANVNETCDKLKERIMTIIKGIIIHTPNTSHCVTEGIELFTDYTHKVRKDIKQCIHDKIHNTQSIYELDHSHVITCDKKFNDEIEKEYYECKTKFEDSEFCIDKVKIEINQMLQDVEDDLKNAAIKAEIKVKGIIETITSCAAKGVNQVSNQIPEVISGIFKCVFGRNNIKT